MNDVEQWILFSNMMLKRCEEFERKADLERAVPAVAMFHSGLALVFSAASTDAMKVAVQIQKSRPVKGGG